MSPQPAYSHLLASSSYVFLRLSMSLGRESRFESSKRERRREKEKTSTSTSRGPSKRYGDWITVGEAEDEEVKGRRVIWRALLYFTSWLGYYRRGFRSGRISKCAPSQERHRVLSFLEMYHVQIGLSASMHLVIRVEDHRDRSAYHAKLPTPAANYALQHQVNDTVPLDGGSLLRQTLSQPVHPYIFVQTQPGSRGFVEPCYSTSEVGRRQVSEREHVFECRSRKRRPGLVDELQLGEAEPRKRND
ncbi:hypothetical protein CPC08DRAFT_494799 [Agrocybe pediades]|nr:hypothetical protein CPC08DRAFT_494799 [Agrocybe pediades]